MNNSLRIIFSNYKTTVRQLLNFVNPILAAHLVGVIIPWMNTILVGKYSQLALAATGLANPTLIALMGFGWGIITSVGILTARQLGQTDTVEKTGAILQSSMITTLLISIPIMALLKLMYPLWLFFKQDLEIAKLGQEYLDGMFWVVFVDLARFSIFQFAIAHHRVRAPIITTLLSIPLIWIVNQNFIHRFGLYGIGLGTALVYWLTFIALWIYLYWDTVFSQCLTFVPSLKLCIKLCKEQFLLGIPIGTLSFIEFLFFVVIALWVGQFGSNPLIAHQIALQCLGVVIMAAVSFAEAVTILVAKAHAKGSVHNALKFVQAGTACTGISMTFCSLLYWLMPHTIINLYLTTVHYNDEVIQLSVLLLIFCSIFQIFDGLRIVLSGALRGLSDIQYPLWVTLIAFWGVGLPTAYFTAFILQWELIGLWIGMTVSVIVMTILQYYRIQYRLFATM